MPEATPKPAPELDIIPTPTNKVEEFLEQHIKKILIGVTLVALVLLTLAISRHFKHQTELEAAETFTAASTVEDCDVVMARYPGTLASGNAQILKADLLWEEGKKESSVETLKDFVAKQNSHPLHAEALLALGSKQLTMGDKAGSSASFDTLKKTYAGSPLIPATDLYEADALWSEGKNDEAKAILDGMLSKYPGKMTAFTNQVDERLRMISAGLPQKELDPPPAPPAPALPAVPAPIPGLPGAPMAVPSLEAPSLITPPSIPAPISIPAPAPVPMPEVPAPAPETPAPAPAPAPETPAPTPAPAPETPAPAPAPAPAPVPAPEAPAPAPAPAPVAPAPAPAPEAPAAQ